MSEHWNVQINIQRLQEPETFRDTSGYAVKVSGREVVTERKVTKVLDLAIVADSEREAYAKAHKMLTANEPEWTESVGHRTSVEPPALRGR